MINLHTCIILKGYIRIYHISVYKIVYTTIEGYKNKQLVKQTFYALCFFKNNVYHFFIFDINPYIQKNVPK